jgi:hypothetical protein
MGGLAFDKVHSNMGGKAVKDEGFSGFGIDV